MQDLKQRISEKNILIVGPGCVAKRQLDILHSIGADNITLVKWGANPNGITTIELKELQDKIGVNHPMYAASGDKLDERLKAMQDYGFNVQGSIDDLDLSKFDFVIDGTGGSERENAEKLYLPNNLPFAIHGGADSSLVKGLFYAGIKGTTALEPANARTYQNSNAKIVSCNTTNVITLFSRLQKVLARFGLDNDYTANVEFERRHRDPHTGKKLTNFNVTTTHKRYHLDEVDFLLPETVGNIKTIVSMWPVEYFHTVKTTITFPKNLPREFADELKDEIQNYERAIYIDGPFSHRHALAAASKIGIYDGDLLFPMYQVEQPWDNQLVINSLTPQRAITTIGGVDQLLVRALKITPQEAFDYNNRHASFADLSLSDHKHKIEDVLRHYDLTKADEEELFRQHLRNYTG